MGRGGRRRQFARKVLPRCDLFTGAGTWGQNGRGGVVPRVSSPSAPRPSSHGVTSPAGTSVSPAPIAPTVSALSPTRESGTDESVTPEGTLLLAPSDRPPSTLPTRRVQVGTMNRQPHVRSGVSGTSRDVSGR